jgi:hypothetical protein
LPLRIFFWRNYGARNQQIKTCRKVILGSIKSQKEMSVTFHLAKKSKIFSKIPESYFGEKTLKSYAFFRKLFDPKNPKFWRYFVVQNPHYLKWSINKILDWKFEENPDVVQILADKDIVFPPKNSSQIL